MSTTKKALIIVGCVTAAVLVILGLTLGIALPLTLNQGDFRFRCFFSSKEN